MKYLKINWVRALISLLTGSLIAGWMNVHRLHTGQPNLPSAFIFLYGAVLYAGLTLAIRATKK